MGSEWEGGLSGGGSSYSEWMGKNGDREHVGMKVVGLEAERRAWCLRQCQGTPMQIGCQEECCRW